MAKKAAKPKSKTVAGKKTSPRLAKPKAKPAA